MTTTMETVDKNKVKMTVEVDAQTFDQGVETAYRKTRSKYNIPGFRKGHAPRKVIENQLGEGIFFEDAFHEVFPTAYEQAVEENGIVPVDRPDVNIVSIGHGQPMIFTAEVFVTPEVKLGQYKGIEVEKVEYTVTDEQLNAEIQQALSRAARFEEADRPIENGDRITLDYSGSFDGKPFEGGTAEDANLDIGSGMFIPGFEEQLIGWEVGQQGEIKVDFPEDYPAEDYAGREAVFTIKINDIKKKIVPELDDETVKDISEFDTVEEYKKSLEERLREEGERMAKDQMEGMALQKVVDNAQIDVPECMVRDELNGMLYDLQMRMRMNGISLEDYFQYTNSSVEQYRETYKEDALQRVRHRLVIEAIEKAENIVADEDSIDAEIEKFAKGRGQDVETFKKSMQEADRLHFEHVVKVTKGIDLIMDNVVYVDPKPEEEKEEKQEDEA